MGKAIHAFGLLICFMLLLKKGRATDFTVGGRESKGWGIPIDSNGQSFNQWAEANRFQVGDSIVFNYPADQDSVLQVSQNDFNNCNTESPIKKYSDGHTVFQFDKSGPYYFISGNKDNCLKNEKLVVIVLADRSNSSSNQTITPPEIAPSPPPQSNQTGVLPPPSNSPNISPSPAPGNSQTGPASSPLLPPSPAPKNNQTDYVPPPPPSGSTDINPTPAPAGEESPSPSPPAGSFEINPTPAPVSEPPPPSAGSLIIPSCIGSIGALALPLMLAF